MATNPKPTPDTGYRSANLQPPDRATPPPFKPSPSPAAATAQSKFMGWAKEHKIATRFAGDIWYWGGQYKNLDPYYWAAVLLAESGAQHLDGNGKLKSSGQAVGIGQIALSWIGQPIPWDITKTFTGDNDPRTGLGAYGVNMRMSAYLMADAISKYGRDGAYTQGYNPNDPNKGKAWKTIQKTYGSRPAGVPPEGPSEGPAPNTPPGTTPYATFKDPYVTGVAKGNKLSLTNDPNKAVQYNGLPLKRSDFLQLKDQLTSWYVSYTGQRPSNAQIDNFVTKNWTTWSLSVLLSKGPNFTKSPIYKQHSTDYNSAATDAGVLGAHEKSIPTELIRQGILNSWNQSTMVTQLRKRPQYVFSNEFEQRVTTLLGVHQSIMGTPDKGGMTSIKDASLAGWDTNQYAAWLRAQDAYAYSPEYQSKTLTFLSSLGLITGHQAVLRTGVATDPGQPASPAIPTDTRIPGVPTLTVNSDLAGSFR